MITIPIKIKREDKAILISLLEREDVSSINFVNLDTLIGYEIYTEILSKLRGSQHNDKPMRLSLVQVKIFKEILNFYSKLGTYERINANILLGGIQKEIYKKAIALQT